MTIESERTDLLKRLKKDSKPDIKAFSKKMKAPYQTILSLVHGKSLGTIRTWLKIERFYTKQK